MDRPEEELSSETRPRGRPFAKGNSGRRPGTKNRRSLVSAALLADEEKELVRKAVELAKSGDTQMLKFLLGGESCRVSVLSCSICHPWFVLMMRWRV